MLAEAGLHARGGFAPAMGETLPGPSGGAAGCIVLVGAVGDSHWQAFSASPEAGDGRPDPLDRWSRRIVDALAATLGARALYPFGGPPHWPFQQWARRAEPLHHSPLGLLIHPRYGLWHSYRAALAFARLLPGLPGRLPEPSPCDTCADRPCLRACPVDAFSAAGYDTRACGGWLDRPEGGTCLAAACLARAACPAGVGYRYGPAAAGFHMAAFKGALLRRSSPEAFRSR